MDTNIKKTRRCQKQDCKKKLRSAEGCICKCGVLFCNTHKYSDKHMCQYDYIENNKITLA